MPIFIDQPIETVRTETMVVFGWVAGTGNDPVTLLINHGRHGFESVDRPDVCAALPDHRFITGIAATIDLRLLAPAEEITITLAIGSDHVSRTVPVDRDLLTRLSRDLSIRDTHQMFCLEHLRCAACAGRALRDHVDAIRCLDCGAVFQQTHRAINMISSALAIESGIQATANISANPYTPAARALIARTAQAGGMVLDCGAGSRPWRTQGVINVEIVDYASTDILAVGEKLPFADGSFDAALSLAVLEHVRDPFQCARELARVVKPGGEILVDVPFLQPVHGFPHHYYNMTAQGLARLFADLAEPLDCVVPPHGHPIFGLQWLLRDYRAGLPASEAGRFATMTVDELLALDAPTFLADPRASALDPATQSKIACLHSLHLRRL